MVCYSPLKVFWSRKRHPVTKNRVPVFSASKGIVDVDYYYNPGNGFTIPCGKCEGCRLAKSFEWSVRCTCESYFHRENYFLTLTYDSEHLPSDRCLNRAHFQGFMKRLRYYFKGYKIKVFYCGEYGENRHRPHYHAIVFGLPLSEKDIRMYPINMSKKGNVNYESPFITKIWGKGLVTIGSFTSSSASYVAQYTLKKNKSNSTIRKAIRPFIGASNRNSIGFDFFMKYFKDIFSRGFFSPIPANKGEKPLMLKPSPYFVRNLKKYKPVEYIRYVRLPRYRAYVKMLNDKLKYLDQYAEDLDNKIRNRYYKERATLRRLEARCDL